MMKAFTVLKKNPIFETNADLVGDIRYGVTVTFVNEVDMTCCEQLRAAMTLHRGGTPTYTALVIKAVSLALRTHPWMNRRMLDLPFLRRMVQFGEVNASVAGELDLDEGRMLAWANTVYGSDRKSLTRITEELRVTASGDPNLNPQLAVLLRIIRFLPGFLRRWVLNMPCCFPRLWVKHRGGAFLVSSPAKYGVDMVVASWPWPLGFSFGLVKERPVVKDGEVIARRTMPLVMNFDRRIVAGGPAARFFAEVTRRLEETDLGEEMGAGELDGSDAARDEPRMTIGEYEMVGT